MTLVSNAARGGAGVASVTAGDGSVTVAGTATDPTVAVAAAGVGTTQLANAGAGAAGPTGSATVTPIVTVDAKGRVTALGQATIAPGMAASVSTPADPAGTASLVGVMMGLAGTITPAVTGRVQITICGSAKQTTINDGGVIQLRHGTGAAPANAAANTGTADGKPVNYVVAGSNLLRYPFSITVLVSGLAVATAVWLDVSLAAVTGGTANIFDLTVTAIEL